MGHAWDMLAVVTRPGREKRMRLIHDEKGLEGRTASDLRRSSGILDSAYKGALKRRQVFEGELLKKKVTTRSWRQKKYKEGRGHASRL